MQYERIVLLRSVINDTAIYTRGVSITALSLCNSQFKHIKITCVRKERLCNRYCHMVINTMKYMVAVIGVPVDKCSIPI